MKNQVETDNVNIEYPYTLALYLLCNCIGMNKSRRTRFFAEAKECRARAVRFMNHKTRRIARLVRMLGTNFLEEILGYQVTMLRLLRYHRLRLVRLNKPGGKDWKAPNNGGFK